MWKLYAKGQCGNVKMTPLWFHSFELVFRLLIRETDLQHNQQILLHLHSLLPDTGSELFLNFVYCNEKCLFSEGNIPYCYSTMEIILNQSAPLKNLLFWWKSEKIWIMSTGIRLETTTCSDTLKPFWVWLLVVDFIFFFCIKVLL